MKRIEDIRKIFESSQAYELNLKLSADYIKRDEFDQQFRVATIAFEIHTKKSRDLNKLPAFEEIRKAAFPYANLAKVKAKKTTLELLYSFEPEDCEYYSTLNQLLNREVHVHHERLSEFIERNAIQEFKMSVVIENQ